MDQVTSGRHPVGTWLNLPQVGWCRVTSNADPSLVALETESGAMFRIGERALAELADDAGA